VSSQREVAGERESEHEMRRAVAFLCILGAPLGLALLDTGVPSRSWWLVAAAPIGLYCIYALGVSRFLPARVAGSVPLRTGVKPRGSRHDTDWLLLIRGLACGLVFIMHIGIIFKHDFSYSHSRWAWILESPAWLGIILFFTLSGYLMGKGFYTGKYDLSRSGVTLYLRNRFLRIFPLMFVVGLFVVGLLATLGRSSEQHLTPQAGVRVLLFGFNGQGGIEAIGAFWSLSTEWQYYLLVPAAFAIALAASCLFPPAPRVLLPVATLLVLGGGFMIRQHLWTHHGGAESWAKYIFPSLFGNIDVFLLGFLTNWWMPRLARLARVIAAVWPLLLVGIYLAYSFVSYEAFSFVYTGAPIVNEQWFRIHAVVMPGAVALALITVLVGCELWNRKARLRRAPRRRTAFLLFWVGELTYPIYLMHVAILLGVQSELPRLSYTAKCGIATILVILIAWVLHMTVEKAVLNWRRRRVTEIENRVVPEALQELQV
jgi:peptidoglycan/LPS O-acetylase OafA/YrhL